MTSFKHTWIYGGILAVALVAGQGIAVAEDNKEGTPSIICGGCVAATHTSQGKGSITPYGRIELDGIYSTRNTNPLDPSQFNGYATAAGKGGNASSTLNPRYSVFGLRGDRTDGTHILSGVVETDFYSQTDNAGNLSPRLRLAYVKYSPNSDKTSVTAGMDWTPIMGLHPNLIDFSIMGYNGNLWQRLPQITVRQQFNEQFNGLITVMRFERGLSACCGQTPNRIQSTGAVASSPFNDPVQMPYIGHPHRLHRHGKRAGLYGGLKRRLSPLPCRADIPHQHSQQPGRQVVPDRRRARDPHHGAAEVLG